MTKYKRTKSDSPLKCPYCGKQFRMTNDRYKTYYSWTSGLRGEDRIRKVYPTVCKKCGKIFKFRNISKAYANEINEPATFKMEDFDGWEVPK